MVLEGDASRDQGRLLGDLYDYRREADYGGGDPHLDIDHLVFQVDRFLEGMEVLIESEAHEE